MNSRTPVVLIAALAILGVALVGVLVPVLGASSDEYGRIPVPGAADVVVEEGEIEIFYAEDSQPETLVRPADLQIRILDPEGEPIRIDPASGTQLSGPGGTAVKIAEITGEEDLRLSVQTRGAQGRPRPEVTIGRDPFEVAVESLGSIAGSPITYLVLVGLGGVAFLAGTLGRLGGSVLRGGHDRGSVERQAGERGELENEPDAASQIGADAAPNLGIDFSTGKPYEPEA